MARDLTPKWKRCRREKASLFGNDKWKRRPTLPGEHPVSRSRPSSYAIHFREKQKVKRMYGMLERQFRRFFRKAKSSKGDIGVTLLQLLEMRLDNVVYRLGIAPTRRSARQLVTHGHITVNGKKLDIPSYIVKIDDEIRLKKKDQKKDFSKIFAEQTKNFHTPKWLEKLNYGGMVKSEPKREMIDESITEQLIVEYYSR